MKLSFPERGLSVTEDRYVDFIIVFKSNSAHLCYKKNMYLSFISAFLDIRQVKVCSEKHLTDTHHQNNRAENSSTGCTSSILRKFCKLL